MKQTNSAGARTAPAAAGQQRATRLQAAALGAKAVDLVADARDGAQQLGHRLAAVRPALHGSSGGSLQVRQKCGHLR